jgi:hypothetical protein
LAVTIMYFTVTGPVVWLGLQIAQDTVSLGP